MPPAPRPDGAIVAPRQEILADAIYTTNEAAILVRMRPSGIRRAVRLGQIQGRGRPFRIRGRELFKLVS